MRTTFGEGGKCGPQIPDSSLPLEQPILSLNGLLPAHFETGGAVSSGGPLLQS